jgi:hypothetical protein
MAADEALLSALQEAHDLEATASELWHKQEHAFKVGPLRIKRLAKWFDRRHKEAYDRQHDLRRHIMRLGGTVETNLGGTGYSNDPGEALETACDVLDDLKDAHEAVRDAAKKAGDRGTVERFHNYQRDIQSVYAKGQQKQAMLKELGQALFIHKHS